MIPWNFSRNLCMLCLLVFSASAPGQDVRTSKSSEGERIRLSLENDQVVCTVTLNGDRLESERLATRTDWARKLNMSVSTVETDADFSMEIMWTGTAAPNTAERGGNPATFTKSDFSYTTHVTRKFPDGAAELQLRFKCKHAGIDVVLAYSLEPGAFYHRRRILIADSSDGRHFLQHLATIDANVFGRWKIVKQGGLGQPAALQSLDGSAFFAIEYPSARNGVSVAGNKTRLLCAQEMGVLLGPAWTGGDWAVTATAPDYAVKRLFQKYFERLCAPPEKRRVHVSPDLTASSGRMRSPNEQELAAAVDILKNELTVKRGARFDAVHLEDGWFDEESEWLPKTDLFPHGFGGLVKRLDGGGLQLGVGLGLKRSSSSRTRHFEWLARRGYEITRPASDDAYPCIAGSFYKKLIAQRVAALADSDKVACFSFHGFRFSCSEADHGHPPGIFSRRACVAAAASVASAMRSMRDSVILELSSDAWLSPYWLRFFDFVRAPETVSAGEDMPHPERIEALITKRDKSMHESLRGEDAWFPLRGISSGPIRDGLDADAGAESLHPASFSNYLLMQIARGGAMQRLDIPIRRMTDTHWKLLADALRWAEHRYPVFKSGEMVGGDPAKRECYGYVFSDGERTVLFARNPWAANGLLRVPLAYSLGVSASAANLVLEQVYPERWIAPRLFKSGEVLNLQLNPWETVVYEIFPVGQAKRPLIAAAPYSISFDGGNRCTVILHDRAREMTLLNPEIVSETLVEGVAVDFRNAIARAARAPSPLLPGTSSLNATPERDAVAPSAVLDPGVDSAYVEILLTSRDAHAEGPVSVSFEDADGARELLRLDEKGASMWLRLDFNGRNLSGKLRISRTASGGVWNGRVAAWIKCFRKLPSTPVTFVLRTAPEFDPLPSSPNPPGYGFVRAKIGETDYPRP